MRPDIIGANSYTDEEVRDLAKEIIADIVPKLKLPPGIRVREVEGFQEFRIESANGVVIAYGPQQAAEGIIRANETRARTDFEDLIKTPDYSTQVDWAVWHSSKEEIEVLISAIVFSDSVIENSKKLGTKVQKLTETAQKKYRRSVSKRPFETAEELREFAALVDELKPLWDYVTAYFQEHDYDSSHCGKVTTEKQFIELAKGHTVPETLIDEVYRRNQDNLDEDDAKRRREPLAFAKRHAAALLMKKGFGMDALNKRYYEGKRLLQLESDILTKVTFQQKTNRPQPN